MSPGQSLEKADDLQEPHELAFTSRTPTRQRPAKFNFFLGVFIFVGILIFAGWYTYLQQFGYLWDPFRGSYEMEKAHDGQLLGDNELPGIKDQYLLGVGKADITGPVVEINMMGYADPKQVGSGLRQRLYSRAFIIGNMYDPADRFIYLVLDTQSGDTAVRFGILAGLRDMGPEYEMYGHNSLAVTGTHSHSGPGAWLNYLLPQITSKGFDHQSYQAIVDGCLLSIRRAHESLEPGYLAIGTTKILHASINRSLFAYLANPESERATYNISTEDDGSVDKEMTILKFQRVDGVNIGVLTWFPTHGTSMLGNNTLISGDNKGVAADLFEKHIRRQEDETNSSDFVAGFSQANMGDVSPNILGAWCEDGSGEMCNFKNSTCSNGRSQHCHARGPHFRNKDNGAASCFEIGKRQYEAALELYKSLNRSPKYIRGPEVKAVHTFHNMSGFEFTLQNGSTARTCPAALGYSFAAGTSDGPGAFDFTQHDSNSSNTSPVWKVVSGFLKKPGQDQIACQAPKPILLDVGEAHKPYEWTPNIVDIQTFRVGQLIIIVSPGEATTMAGRRWKNAVATTASQMFHDELGGEPPIVVLGAPANSYTHYISTEEEYGIQRYEGASTLYGPNTLEAYINRTINQLPFLGAYGTRGTPYHDSGPLPPDNSNRSLSFIPGVVFDGTPWFRKFGDVKSDVDGLTKNKGETATATFVGANPRSNLRLESTYAAVEFRSGPQWKTVRDDSDWTLIFGWRRTSEILGTSEVEIAWEIEDWAQPGLYRLRYYGDAKSVGGQITAFDGMSSAFLVV
ncbi:Fc.00g100830.m01.CDS01 [Cosmosporella sp. VM-42]